MPPCSRRDLVDHRRDAGLVGHVAGHPGRAPALAGDLRGGRAGGGAVDVGEDHVRAPRRQRGPEGLAEAAAAAGDHRHLALVYLVVHLHLLSSAPKRRNRSFRTEAAYFPASHDRYPSHAAHELTPLLGDRLAGAERGDLVGRCTRARPGPGRCGRTSVTGALDRRPTPTAGAPGPAAAPRPSPRRSRVPAARPRSPLRRGTGQASRTRRGRRRPASHCARVLDAKIAASRRDCSGHRDRSCCGHSPWSSPSASSSSR